MMKGVGLFCLMSTALALKINGGSGQSLTSTKNDKCYSKHVDLKDIPEKLLEREGGGENVAPHWFQFRESVLCVPQKNGNRNFGALAYLLQHGRIPAKKNVNGAVSALGLDRLSKDQHLYFVARNPYSRLLSYFLCFREPKDPEHFREFVHQEVAAHGREPQLGNHHWAKQTSLCMRTKHITILRLEEMHKWFNCWANDFNMTEKELGGTQWNDVAGRPCWYTPTGDCKDMFAEYSPDHQFQDAIHGTGSSDKVSTFYDAETAQLVYHMYKEDFKTLGYNKDYLSNDEFMEVPNSEFKSGYEYALSTTGLQDIDDPELQSSGLSTY